ncbi:MAG: alpha/beta hydrolase [Ilumatobacteraceae bacterium]|jgi:pimeloyl-ACP methyl ester carboxylesterase|nr:alpha/beta hydrolase [Acidimicrobiaceae bacterium]MBP6488059.1 alpha/beta hydrolase [Ilumatobacteraceae bacterium]MBP7891053.1 alpha/beta hydrolase [Ilumatobacteraceae bacterium]MBP8211222.1 alpha/beta hydrolase [Ilumatobacteraceae bacterium]HQY15080.1 alpha/beta hydrolase [Ilumatobacteraceae bacterium]
MTAITSGSVSANGVDFGYLTAGDPAAPLALCVHGFPDSAHTWRHLLPRLAEAGFRAVAPFQRGYAPTSVPADGRYQTGVLAQDMNMLHEALGGGGDAVIIGHDWGAPATYGAAVLGPERWRKVVGLAVPPGPAFGMSLVTNLVQLKRSWYMFFFQSPFADMVVPANDMAYIDMLWADWSPGYDASHDLPLVKAALGDPASLAAALGYYRAALGDGFKDPTLEAEQAAAGAVPTQPTLYLHGRDDGGIGPEVAELAATMTPPNVTVEIVDHAGHFLQLEQAELVNARILEFLG